MKNHLLTALSLALFAACEGGAPTIEHALAGGPTDQAAVERGLAWLAAHQD